MKRMIFKNHAVEYPFLLNNFAVLWGGLLPESI